MARLDVEVRASKRAHLVIFRIVPIEPHYTIALTSVAAFLRTKKGFQVLCDIISGYTKWKFRVGMFIYSYKKYKHPL